MSAVSANYNQPGASGAANESSAGGLDNEVTGRNAGGGINGSTPVVTDLWTLHNTVFRF